MRTHSHFTVIFTFVFSFFFFYVPSVSAEESEKFDIRWTLDEKKLDEVPAIPGLETKTLYLADGISPSDMGAYSHHPHVCYHAGRLYAIWSNHLQDEDGAGQRVLARQSADFGKTWEPPLNERPAILFPSLDDWKRRSEKVTDDNRTGTANGFAIVDGTLYAVNEVLATSNQYGGKGRLVRRIYDDGTFGEIFWIELKRPKSQPGYPEYPDMSDPKYTETGKKIIAFLSDKTKKNLLTWDFKGPRNTSTELDGGKPGSPLDGHFLCEPTASYRTPDEVLVTLWRDLGGRPYNNDYPVSLRLYISYSRDSGNHWTIPERTTVLNSSARPWAGNLPDGRILLLNNPISRKHLLLTISKDGHLFDQTWLVRKVEKPRRFEGGGDSYSAAYQHACIAGDFLFVIYSINKEDVEIARIPLASLTASTPK